MRPGAAHLRVTVIAQRIEQDIVPGSPDPKEQRRAYSALLTSLIRGVAASIRLR